MIRRNRWRLALWISLLLTSYLFWQWRYEKVSVNLIADDACEDARKWQGMAGAPTVSFSPDGLVMKKTLGGQSSSISMPLGDLGASRHLAVKCDVAWENCQRDPRALWAMPRVVVHGIDAAGNFFAPMDHGVIAARGTRQWHREHVIMEIPTPLTNARLGIDTLGIQGTLRVKHLRIEMVQPRSWSEAVGIFLCCCWCAWLGWLVHPWLVGRWRFFRSLLLGAAICCAFGVFVFPQPRSLERSLGLQFWLGTFEPPQVPVVPPLPKLDVIIAETKSPAHRPEFGERQMRTPRLRTIPPPTADVLPEVRNTILLPEVVKSPAANAPPPVHVRASALAELLSYMRNFLRELDTKWNLRSYNLTHFTAFFGIGLCVILLSNRARMLWVLVVIAVFAEIVPAWIHDIGDQGDYYDILANFSGIFVAYLVYRFAGIILRSLRRKHLQS